MDAFWNINPVDPVDGERFYIVDGASDADQIRFSVNTESQARELRDVLNRLGRNVTTFARAD